MNSINTRLLLAASVILIIFLGLTGLTLDRAFQQSVKTALKDRLQAYIYLLIGAADVDPQGRMHMPDALQEARFSNPSSGLYAQMSANDGSYVWVSPSTIGFQIPFVRGLKPADLRFDEITPKNANPVYALSFGFSWELDPQHRVDFTVNVAESVLGYQAQVASFRNNLWGWLIGVTVMLLLVQASILRWGLTPLRQVADDLNEIETGKQQQLLGPYPAELRGLTQNLNRLIVNERTNLKRYQDTLGDLAHSLKTPLSVLRSLVENKAEPEELTHNLGEQIDRMTHIVNYQLQRAVTTGHVTFEAPVSVNSVVDRVLNSLQKVYQDKHINIVRDEQNPLVFRGAEGDLLEIFGNLLDNAHKWCRQAVHIHAAQDLASNPNGLLIRVEDDGPGIPSDQARAVLKRGIRADSRVEGHGIGLSIVKDIVQAYSGNIAILESPLGGACIEITLQGR